MPGLSLHLSENLKGLDVIEQHSFGSAEQQAADASRENIIDGNVRNSNLALCLILESLKEELTTLVEDGEAIARDKHGTLKQTGGTKVARSAQLCAFHLQQSRLPLVPYLSISSLCALHICANSVVIHRV
jgi:hypothetical protein